MSALTLGPAVMFTPADRPERYATALERADAVILDLEDAVTGLAGLASIVAVVGDGDAAEVARTLAGRVGDVAHAGEADRTIVPARLREIAAV